MTDGLPSARTMAFGALAFGALFLLFPELDQAVSTALYRPGLGFLLRGQEGFEFLHRHVGVLAWLGALAALAVALAGRWWSRLALCGDASVGFGLVALAFVARRPRPWLLAGIAAGAALGLMRMAQGGHYLSDVVFAFYAVWFTSWALSELMQLTGGPLRPPA